MPHSYDKSPSNSPVKKKPRLSASPGHQHARPFVQPCFGSTISGHASNPGHDPDNPFTLASNRISPTRLRQPSSALPSFGFAAASSISQSRERSPSPEAPPEHDFEAWFKPPSTTPAIGFQTAAFSTPSTTTSNTPGFVSLGSKALLAPSAAALAKAQQRMREIWDSDQNEAENADPSSPKPMEKATAVAPDTPQPSFQRAALQPLENNFRNPGTPTPAGFSHFTLPGKQTAIDQLKQRSKAFRSPLIKSSPGSASVHSPLNPNNSFSSALTFPTQSVPFAPSTPVRPSLPARGSSALLTPGRNITGSARGAPASFVTPFKPGMRPGESGWAALQESLHKGGSHGTDRSLVLRPNPPSASRQGRNDHKTFFSLSPPADRTILAKSGLRPQRFTREDLESLNINILELQQMSPTLAMHYSFYTVSTQRPSQPIQLTQLLGPAAALKELHDRGCILATKPWVDNHWGLILWKLAGMVALDPNSESDPSTKRWCWAEVRRQLLLRYERELNQTKRPALRLIATQDAPAAFPMVLCISDIFWVTPDSGSRTAYPELEVTDGWYRLKAKIDAPMARAVRRGIIRIGRKIGVAGAKLNSERKEPQEILEAYNSVKLTLSGNSSHLMPWDAKLGFTRGPCISTMHSLTPDGGPVAAMDVVVVKTYPIAFLEFLIDEHGRRRTEGPRNETDEMKLNEEWKKKRELEASKISTEFEKKVTRYESYMDKLERRAGTGFQANQDDGPPDHIEKLYDQLEEHDDAVALLSRIVPQDAGWLAKHIRRCMEADRGRITDEIEKELEASCPPRDIRNFKVIVVQDSQTCRRPAYRHAQLTVWDVLSLTLSEGAKAGSIETGSRFLITNLNPTIQSAWMGHSPGAQIFLSTTRLTRWIRLKSPS